MPCLWVQVHGQGSVEDALRLDFPYRIAWDSRLVGFCDDSRCNLVMEARDPRI